ncbi:MAG: M24 family metallopeptidase [Planctomycetes bacterium]|nr:M24 family metallopeptidase [Planctomycetota bacterium]
MDRIIRAEGIRYGPVAEPNLELPRGYPALPAEAFRSRLERLERVLAREQAGAVVVYGDREHFANLSWLTGIEPRFEEAIAVFTAGRPPAVLLGNECLGLAEWTPAPVRAIHWPALSLNNQPRSGIRPLPDLLREAGLPSGQRIGVAGWKCPDAQEFRDPEHTFETPSFLVDTLREMAGRPEMVFNATSCFMGPEAGLRVVHEPAAIAQLEAAAALASHGVSRLLQALEPGRSELELAECFQTRGLPLSCHPMVSTGPKARFGLTSPSDRRVQRGDAFTTALGICGGLTCRAGYVAESLSDIPAATSGWMDEIARPFFAAVATWYQALRIGLPGGELFDLMEERIPRARFGWSLNPGHLLGLDEWISSPVYPGSRVPFRSGMAVQMDIIPAPREGCCGGNVEDGVVLADEGLRAQLASGWPEVWRRILLRRRFMTEVLGIALDDSVLPLSQIPGLWRPLLLDRRKALAAH